MPAQDPARHRALLARETEHFTPTEQDALTASLNLARELARCLAPDCQPALSTEAIALALGHLGDLPLWVRVLVAKAAVEHPANVAGDGMALMVAVQDACARLAA